MAGPVLRLLELHRHRFAVGGGHFEELPQLEAEHSGQNIGRKGLDLRVQVAHHRVVVAARVLDRVFRLAERALQLGELLGGFS